MDSPISESSLDFQAFEELNSPTAPIPYYELRDVVKWSKEASENLYVVEETTVFFPTTNSITKLANVLTQAQLHRKLCLRGRIVVDGDQEDQLIVYENGVTLNGSWIFHEGDFSKFSIAFPNTLWIPTHLGYLEIRTSREYHDIYTEMMHAIGIFYVALFHYEDYGLEDGYGKDFNHMAAILNFYTVHVDGRGLFLKDVIGIATKYAKFMFNEYTKEKSKGALHGNHMFFNWLQDGCKLVKRFPIAKTGCQDLSPEQYQQYFEKARQRIKREYDSLLAVSIPEPLPDLPKSSEENQAPQSKDLPSTSVVSANLTMTKTFYGSYISPQFPQGINAESSIPEKIAALICHAISSGRQQLQQLTINNVVGALHRDYSVCSRQVCHELVMIYRASIITYLPSTPPWTTSELFSELFSPNYSSLISSSQPHHSNILEQINCYIEGSKKLIHRENKCLASPLSVTATSKTIDVTQSPSPDLLEAPLRELPNREPNIISLPQITPKSLDHINLKRSYGIRRATYGVLEIYD
ncbi:hypothetical protein GcC1_017026 [Golovinomyces cichoracearum]|uniref:Uncharacterized protein n=1 Tax=Golovinomyces cichoracearum TaxID=62708 RepID=A0A420J5U4_9PEZI|nr:hypothetical protein GcC1_017026 [Golovinomyces cichoracearum]